MNGCPRPAAGSDDLAGHCPECGHKPLQHTDREEVLASYGYCIVCAVRIDLSEP